MKLIHKIARRIEHKAAFIQGKGFSLNSVALEASMALNAIGGEPRLVLDIGANVGDYSSAVRSHLPDCEIHSFEPSAINISRLTSRFSDDDLTHIVPHALSSATGKSELFFDIEGSGLASLTQRRLDHFGIDFSSSSEISTIRFDEYWKDNLSKRQIDFAKIDVEGHEMDVLDGFGDALSHCHAIQFEFGGANIDTRTFFQDFWYFLTKASFEIFRFTKYGLMPIEAYSEIDEHFRFTNFLAIKK